MATQNEKKADFGSVEVMRKRYDRASDYADKLYDLARDDIKFVTIPGAQWDDKLKARRGDRPMYQFDKLSAHTRQVVNEMRQARPQGKVRGTEKDDQALAELMQGLARNIESVSNADDAHDIAFESAVEGGFGVWRICTDYTRDDDFDLDIFIKPVYNAFSVKFDPAAVERDRRDGMFAFVEETMSKDEFERTYPKASVTDFFEDRDCARWRDAGKVKVAEYWWKEPVNRELWAITRAEGQPAEIVWADELRISEADLAESGITLVKKRAVATHKVMMRVTNGHEFLTDPHEFPSKFIPLVPVWGNIKTIDGEDYWQGMVRPSKDQQRLHNVHKTAAIEAVAKAPKAPFIGRMSWIKGFEGLWQRANSEDFSFLPITEQGEIPKRAEQAEVPVALLQLAQLDNEDIKATTGQYNPSLGAQSNETSGKAIGLRRAQSATATFNYSDNLTKAIRYEYDILVDMIPRVYDTQRVVRVLGADGAEDWKTLYQEVVDPQTGESRKINDISKGKYDTTVTVGPSYATQRLEAADAFTQLGAQIGSAAPQLSPLIVLQVLQNLDLPGAEEMTGALRKMLIAQGLIEPKEGEEAPPQQAPDPRVMATLEKLMSEVRKNNATAAKTEAEAQAVLPQASATVDKTTAEAVATQLQNLLTSGELARILMQQMQPAAPPPAPMMIPPQPPQGGFFVGADPGAGFTG